eukprot:Pompholyxophrys_punicea_v1_NODE_3_length_10569_cov_612.508655.p10 type:complete len:113 gc:universal NODE_3_length_10569_cov_612.508655:892-1230(+)
MLMGGDSRSVSFRRQTVPRCGLGGTGVRRRWRTEIDRCGRCHAGLVESSTVDTSWQRPAILCRNGGRWHLESWIVLAATLTPIENHLNTVGGDGCRHRPDDGTKMRGLRRKI